MRGDGVVETALAESLGAAAAGGRVNRALADRSKCLDQRVRRLRVEEDPAPLGDDVERAARAVCDHRASARQGLDGRDAEVFDLWEDEGGGAAIEIAQRVIGHVAEHLDRGPRAALELGLL